MYSYIQYDQICVHYRKYTVTKVHQLPIYGIKPKYNISFWSHIPVTVVISSKLMVNRGWNIEETYENGLKITDS